MMDSNKCDTGLATPSLHHGCSTGVHEGKWIKVTRKSGGDKNIKDDKENMTYAKALMSNKVETSNSESSKQGYPPVAEIKTDKNKFSILNSDDEEQVNDEASDDGQHKSSVGSHTDEPPKKKKKVNDKVKSNESFYDICDYYAMLPAPVYAYSAHATKYDNSTQILVCNESMSSDDESYSSYEEEHLDDYHQVNPLTMDDIRFTDDIYKFNHMNDNQDNTNLDGRIQYDINLNKSQIRQAFEEMVKGEKGNKLQKIIYMA